MIQYKDSVQIMMSLDFVTASQEYTLGGKCHRQEGKVKKKIGNDSIKKNKTHAIAKNEYFHIVLGFSSWQHG